MKKVFVLTLGCPRNLVDSEVLSGKLSLSGFSIVDNAEESDIAVVNTCGFIEDAKKESIDCILQLAEMRKSGKIKKLIVSGCLAQRYSSEIKSEIKEIDGIFGTSDFMMIPEILSKLSGKRTVARVSSSPEFLYDHTSPRNLITPRHSVYVKIQEGCSNVCSYCVIPSLKGPRRSRDIASVAAEVVDLREKYDVKEIILIGQDTTSFGFDRPGTGDISDLIKEISGIMSEGWVRLLYTHPAHFDDRLIEAMASCDNVCKYVDLPVQHLNDDILVKMNRRVSKKAILSLIDRIRSSIEGVTIRTSVIVGFPGETERQFSELIDTMERVRFDRLGAFIYSREDGTPASGFSGQIPEKIKKERFKKVMEIQQGISAEKNRDILGRTLKVIIDEKEEGGGVNFTGRSEMDAPEVDGVVYVTGKNLNKGEFADVRITGVMEYDLMGEAV